MSSRTVLDALRDVLTPCFDALCVIALYLVLYALGYGADGLWWCLIFGVLGYAQQHPAIQRFLAGGDPGRRAVRRMALLLATGAAFIYGTGWGPALIPGFSLVVAMHVGVSGSCVWRPGVALAGLGTGAGQLPRARQDSSDIIAISDSNCLVTYISPAIQRLQGFAPEELIGSSVLPLIHPDDHPVLHDQFKAAAQHPGRVVRAELRGRHSDGSYQWSEACLRDLTSDPDVRGYVATIRDIDERKAAEKRLAYAANHDPLTGLVNRAEFGRALDAACASGDAAVLFVDLDGFKQVNDEHGHEIGDALLLATADYLRAATPAGGVIGRFGGDEFAIVLPPAAANDAVSLAERILRGMDAPVRTDVGPLLLRASIGVAAPAGHECAGARELLRTADLAMYRAKKSGTHRYEVESSTAVRV